MNPPPITTTSVASPTRALSARASSALRRYSTPSRSPPSISSLRARAPTVRASRLKGNCRPEDACATPEPSGFLVDPDDVFALDQVHVVLGPVLVGAEDQGFALHRALQELLGQGRALVGPVVLVAEQGDVLVEAERPEGHRELDAGLAGADDQQPGAGWDAVRRRPRRTLPARGDVRAHGYTWVSGVVTNSSSSSVRRSWQDSRELSSRSTAVP